MRKFIHGTPFFLMIVGFFLFQNFTRVPARFLPGVERETENTAMLKQQRRQLRIPASVQEHYQISQAPVQTKSPEDYFKEQIGLGPKAGTISTRASSATPRSCEGRARSTEPSLAGEAEGKEKGTCSTEDSSGLDVSMDLISGRLQVENLGPVNAEIRYLADQKSIDVDFSSQLSSDAKLRFNVNPREQSGNVNIGIGW